MTVTLRGAVAPAKRGNIARFAEKVGVSWTTAWRWTLPSDHPRYIIASPRYWDAIEKATAGHWRAPYSVFSGRPGTKPHPRSKAGTDHLLANAEITYATNEQGMSAVLVEYLDP